MLKIYSWNVNGIRAISKKGFIDWMDQDKDIVCVQELKAQDGQIPIEIISNPFFETHCNFAEKKGYSGVGTFTQPIPKKVNTGFPYDSLNIEGRVLEITYDDFILYNIYFPNGKKNQERLDYKMQFYNDLSAYLKEKLKENPNIVVCGDVNTAHNEIDLARPKPNMKNSGFLDIERKWITSFLNIGFVDSFRKRNPDTVKYSWWDYKTRARERNTGWRIDYFFVSENLDKKVINAQIHNDIMGSDHCPLSITLDI